MSRSTFKLHSTTTKNRPVLTVPRRNRSPITLGSCWRSHETHTKNVDHVKVIKSETCFIYLPLPASTQHPKSRICLCRALKSIGEPPPVSIIQFSSAARIDQSSLRCLLFANNFSFLLSNSLICFTGAGIFLYVVFLFVFRTQLYVLDHYVDAATESDAFVVVFLLMLLLLLLLRPASIQIM